MKVLKFISTSISALISVITILVILILYVHDYPGPKSCTKLHERTSYLWAFAKANSKEEVQERMEKELKEDRSVMNDFLTIEWSIENNNYEWLCKHLDHIQKKIDYYKVKKSQKKDKSIADELFMVDSLIKKYDELKERCLQEN